MFISAILKKKLVQIKIQMLDLISKHNAYNLRKKSLQAQIPVQCEISYTCTWAALFAPFFALSYLLCR